MLEDGFGVQPAALQTPEMAALWSDGARFDLYLRIELEVCEAWARLGRIPVDAVKLIRDRARVDLGLIQNLGLRVSHEFVAFLASLEVIVGPPARFIHLGLTSSDVTDTATALQLVQATDALLAEHHILMSALHRWTVTLTDPERRALLASHGRNTVRLLQARQTIGVGKISGAVGTYATVPPQIEQEVCSALNLSYELVSNQVVQRDRYAEFGASLAIVAATIDEIARVLSTEGRRFSIGTLSSLRAANRLARVSAAALLQNVALWHERDISHSSSERVVLPLLTHAVHYSIRTLCSAVVADETSG
jgi:adenylosuccinate lyase